MPRLLLAGFLLTLAACGREETPRPPVNGTPGLGTPPAGALPPAPPGTGKPRIDVRIVPPGLERTGRMPPPVPPPVEPAKEYPRPEAGLPAPAALTDAEREVAGAWRLREFVAMSGQVPGGDARLVGTLDLGGSDRRATLRVESYRLQPPPGSQGTYLGGGRWRREGDELVLEPFETVLGTRVMDPVGPWALRWTIVREDGRVLLKAGGFTYERAASAAEPSAAK